MQLEINIDNEHATPNRKKAKVKTTKTSKPATPQQTGGCKNCGSSHEKGQCKAYGKVCNFCQTPNHFAKVCFKRKHQQASRQDQTQSCMNELSDVEDMDDPDYVIASNHNR